MNAMNRQDLGIVQLIEVANIENSSQDIFAGQLLSKRIILSSHLSDVTQSLYKVPSDRYSYVYSMIGQQNSRLLCICETISILAE